MYVRKQSARGVWEVLGRSWLVITIIAVLFGLAAAVYCIRQTPEYTATATLYTTSGSREAPSTAYDNTMGSQQRVQGYAQLVYTDAVLAPALAASKVDMSIDEARAAVGAAALPSSSIIKVSATTPDREDSARLANAVSASLTNAVARIEVPAGGLEPTSRLTILSVARAEQTPEYPKTVMIVGIAVLLGIVVGIVIALVRELFNRRIRDKRDVGRLLNVPLDRVYAVDLPGDDDNSGALSGPDANKLVVDVLQGRLHEQTVGRSVAVTAVSSTSLPAQAAHWVATELADLGEQVALIEFARRDATAAPSQSMENRADSGTLKRVSIGVDASRSDERAHDHKRLRDLRSATAVEAIDADFVIVEVPALSVDSLVSAGGVAVIDPDETIIAIDAATDRLDDVEAVQKSLRAERANVRVLVVDSSRRRRKRDSSAGAGRSASAAGAGYPVTALNR